jgi:farnesyl-diphosphate farnesyltransferase
MPDNHVFYFNVAQESYLSAQMNKVSRSFAVVVSNVEQPLRGYLSIAYLLCRVADNIEDCTNSLNWKKKRFSEFIDLLGNPSNAADVLEYWEAESWPGLTLDEANLMGFSAGRDLWDIYASIQRAEQEIIKRWITVMAERMSYIGEVGHHPSFIEQQGIHMLASKNDYDDYCYIVAGTVGHMATELVIDYYNLNKETSHEVLRTCEACGRALQKTNILKDFVKDLARGISYLPDEWLSDADYSPVRLGGAQLDWKQMVFEDILNELNTATEYVLALPKNVIGYRMATLLCLLPALQTNLLAAKQKDKLFTPNHQYKITRLTLSQCMLDARHMVQKDGQIRAYSQRVQTEVGKILSDKRWVYQ